MFRIQSISLHINGVTSLFNAIKHMNSMFESNKCTEFLDVIRILLVMWSHVLCHRHVNVQTTNRIKIYVSSIMCIVGAEQQYHRIMISFRIHWSLFEILGPDIELFGLLVHYLWIDIKYRDIVQIRNTFTIRFTPFNCVFIILNRNERQTHVLYAIYIFPMVFYITTVVWRCGRTLSDIKSLLYWNI